MSTPRALKPLRNPAYRWLAAALVSSMIGTGIWMVALVWQIVAIGGGNGVRINGAADPAVGQRVFRSGSTSGLRDGKVTALGATVNYPEGTVTGLIETTVCAEPGDSGGPLFSEGIALGVTSGGNGDCTSGGTTYYQPINPLLETYGLALKTSTSGTGTPGGIPDEPGGTWAPGQVYGVGSEVTYGGVTYKCVQPHQAQTAWQPAGTPTLWQRF